MSDLDLYADLVTRKLISSDGGAVTLPTLVLGDRLRLTLRTFERSEAGDLRERDLRVRTLHASLGKMMEPPGTGEFTLRVGGHATGAIPATATIGQFRTALGTHDSFTIEELLAPTTGCWLLRLGGGEPVAVELVTNLLRPTAFVRIRAFQQTGRWWHEVRLIRAPLSFNDGHERVLPSPPAVRRIREGKGGTDTEPAANELQALRLPPDFRGTYFLRWNFHVSKLLGIQDGPDEIAGALNAMFSSGKRFEATNPEPDHAYIEFINGLGEAAQPLITVEVNTFAPGVLSFGLPLDYAELAAALRATPQIEVPFEVEVEIVDDGEDIADPAVPGRTITLFQQPVKIVREQIWEELATVHPIDWLRPPQPRDYIPFTPDQIIVGVQHYVAVFGDGELRSFSFHHNLGTEAFHLTVRENASGGHLVRVGDDCTVTIVNEHEIVLNFSENTPAPALNSLALVLSSAGPRSAFLAHTHTMAQIVGLLDALLAVYARLEAIEDLLPYVNPALPTIESKPIEITIPDQTEIFPGRLLANADATLKSDNLPTTLPRAAGLLPAIHDATVVPIGVPLPAAATRAGEVFRNDTGAPFFIAGGLGRRGASLEPGGFIGSDGRVWYRLTNVPETNSFFPTDFERELFLFAINEQMLRPGQSFTLDFDIALQLLQANTRGQYLIVIELGSVPGQLTPAPTAENLFDVVWQPVPLLAQRVIVSSLQLKHHFGASIRRDKNGALLANRLVYNAWEAGATAPAGPNFVIRARLVQWDTENSVRGAKGNVFYSLTDAKAQID